MSAPPSTHRAATTGLSIWLTATAAILLLIGLWGTCAWQQWGGDPNAIRDPTEILVYRIFAAAVTAIVIPGLYLQIRKVRALTTRGLTTQGRIEKISRLTRHGLSPTTIVYTVNNQEYRIRRDLPRNKLEPGGQVTILYDPQNPNCFAIQL
jgi:hypothetical protein